MYLEKLSSFHSLSPFLSTQVCCVPTFFFRVASTFSLRFSYSIASLFVPRYHDQGIFITRDIRARHECELCVRMSAVSVICQASMTLCDSRLRKGHMLGVEFQKCPGKHDSESPLPRSTSNQTLVSIQGQKAKYSHRRGERNKKGRYQLRQSLRRKWERRGEREREARGRRQIREFLRTHETGAESR